MSLDIGQVLGGRYAIERVLGRSALGAVYQGCDQTTNQRVSIRLILPEFDNDQVAAFVETDARIAGQLTNKHIARLINIGFLPTGERCIIGEFVEGETLANRLKRGGALPEIEIAPLLLQLLDALAAAHKAGLVHRDLTPSSVLVARGADVDEATLIDFGICRLQALIGNATAAQAAGLEAASLQYLSPEQLNGARAVEPCSNIYSLGAIAYEALTGRRPFERSDFSDPSLVVLQQDPTPVEELAPQSSSSFVQLIRKAMARSPQARFQSADEMTAAITSWVNRPKTVAFLANSPAFTPPVSDSGSGLPPASPGTSPAPGMVMTPPRMPLEEVLAQMAPGEPRATSDSVAAKQPSAPVGPEEVPPPRIPAAPEIQLPPSARLAAALAAANATPPPPPPPMDPTAADIDQSVVDALFAPPPMSADADLPSADDWEEHPNQAPERKSAPFSERLSSRFEPPPVRQSSPAIAPPSSPENPPPVRQSSPAIAPPSSPENPPPITARSVGSGVRAPVVVPPVRLQVQPGSDGTARDFSALADPARASATDFASTTSDTDNPVPSSRPSSSSAPTQPYTTLPDEIGETREKRTIIGLGGYGNYPLPTDSSPVASSPVQDAPVTKRASQATAPGITSVVDAASTADVLTAAASASVPQQQIEPQPVAAAAADVEASRVQDAAISAALSPAEASRVQDAAISAALSPAEASRVQEAATAAVPSAAESGGVQEAATAAVPSSTDASRVEDAVAAAAPISVGTSPIQGTTSVAPMGGATPTSQQRAAASAPVAATSPSAPPKPMLASSPAVSVAADALDDLGPYGKSRFRSRKPLVIGGLFVVLAGVGLAVALMQNPAEESSGRLGSSVASAPVAAPRAFEPSQPKSAPTPAVGAQTEFAAGDSLAPSGKGGASLSQAVNAGLHSPSAAAVPGKKSATGTVASSKPTVTDKAPTEKAAVEKPAAPKLSSTTSAKPSPIPKAVGKSASTASVPTKPAGSKPSKDPYNYR